MTKAFALAFSRSRFRRIEVSLFVLALASLPVPSAAERVSFRGTHRSVNLGSQAVGSPSAAISLPFTIGANTNVGSIAVFTTGIAGKDFSQAKGSTCKATTYATATNCLVNLSFTPMVSGLRRGAVVFYSGPHNSGTALATVPVFGVGTGPQVVFGPGGSETRVGGKFISPEGVDVDAAGDVYVTDIGLQEVFKIAPDGKQTTVGGAFEVPAGVAVDGAGNVYITDSQAVQVFKVMPGGGVTTIGRGFEWPSGVAVDGEGNVYVSDPFIVAVYKIAPDGVQTTVGGGYNTPAGVAVDAAGNVYVADTYDATVFRITPGGKQTTLGSGLISPAAVAVDAAGNVYITDAGSDTLYKVAPDGTQTTVSQGLDVPNGVALSGSGNLYLANTFNQDVLKVDRADAPSLSFEPTRIGSTSADSPKTVEVENIGNAALEFSALTYPTDFPEAASYDGDCTSSTSLTPAGNCALTIDFTPVTPLGSKTSAVLKEAVKLTTNSLNVPKKLEQVTVTGKEIRK
jgi:large repetitive protein